jgi:polyisoprenoid-binding protein YceI
MNCSTSMRVVVAVFAMILAAPVHAAKWRSIPAESSLEFVVTFEGEESVGRFGVFDTETEIDPENGNLRFLHVTVDVRSATLFSADLDEAIAEKAWFDSATYPEAGFTGGVAQPAESGKFVVNGKVTIKGVERELALPLQISIDGERMQLSGEVSLSRKDFAIGTGEWMDDSSIGYGINVRYKVLLQKTN